MSKARTLSDKATAGRKNAIINGNFDIWQRGILFSTPASNAYTADRFKVFYDGTGSFFVEKSDTIGTGGRLRWNQSGAISGCTFRQLRQPIEGVKTLAGSTVTISIRIEAIGSPFTASLSLEQVFGSGGTPSAAVLKTGAPFTVAVGTNVYTTTIALDSVAGKTIGTNNNDALILALNLPTSGTFDAIIENIQLEAGEVATDFEQRSYGEELALCQRYYETGATKASATGSTGTVTTSVFKVTKRVTPAMVYGNSPQGAGTSLPVATDFLTVSEVANFSSSPSLNYSWSADAEL